MKPGGPSPKVIVPGTTRRDAIVGGLIGLIILGFVTYGVMSMGQPQESRNILVGEIVEKRFIPQKEEQISFSGRRIEGVKQIDGEYALKVRVEKENRIYEVPVERPVYQRKKVGDKLEFVRPSSEQR